MTDVSASQTNEKRRAPCGCAPYSRKRTSNEAFVGHADPGVPLKNLRTRRGRRPRRPETIFEFDVPKSFPVMARLRC